MASKRHASNDLNHENWDQEDEPEEAGVFQKASDDILRKRVVKTAKRRNPISTEGEKKNVFSGFSFQGNVGENSNKTSGFSFLNNLSKKDDTPKINGNSSSTPFLLDKEKSSVASSGIESKNHYFERLKGLNESVSKWIKHKVEENPIVSLVPIFKDYEKYLSEIEKYNSNNKLNTSSTLEFKSVSAECAGDSSSEKNIFGSLKNQSNSKENAKSVGFSSFSMESKLTPSSVGTTSAPTIANTLMTPTFSFGSSSGTTSSIGTFTFANPSKIEEKKTEESNDDNDDEPPKVELKPVIEDNHVYMVRCKVFFKKDGGFSNGSVGNLFLKPVQGSDKTQLIVRADTNLGNLLCNFILSENIPIKKMGSKDVMLVCIPTPDAKPPPVPVLLRVKSSEEAETLLQTLEKHKK